jgi:hypothetical protein
MKFITLKSQSAVYEKTANIISSSTFILKCSMEMGRCETTSFITYTELRIFNYPLFRVFKIFIISAFCV